MKKKILSIVICCVMLVSLLPQTQLFAFAATSGTCGDNLTWTLDDEGTLTISGEGEMATYSEKNIPWYSMRSEIKNAIVGSGVEQLDSHAFIDCPNLVYIEAEEGNPYFSSIDGVLYSNYGTESLYLVKCPEGYSGTLKVAEVEGINSEAIINCEKVCELIIPAAYLDKIINESPVDLSGCKNLTSITVSGSSNYSNVYYFSKDGLLYRRTYYNSQYQYTLLQCAPGLSGSIEILDVDYIGNLAFACCDMLSAITLPKTLVGIRFGAFLGCISLCEVYYKGSVTAWNEVSIDGGNEILTNATIYFDVVSVTSISVNKTESKLRKGETEILAETIFPWDASNKNVFWSSSDTSVATVTNGEISAVGVGCATITATTEDGRHTATCEVTVFPVYSYGQTVQIGLIEPWFLKANARVYTDENPTNIDYSSLVDYGAYFIRKSELSDVNATQETVFVEDIINDTDAVKYSKSAGTATIDGSYITATYDKGLYTYELDDSVFVLFYIQDGAGIKYAPIRERNLKSLCEARMNDTENFPSELERSVYSAMLAMYNATKAYRDDYYANH